MRRAMEMLKFTVLIVLAIYLIFYMIHIANWILTKILLLEL